MLSTTILNTSFFSPFSLQFSSINLKFDWKSLNNNFIYEEGSRAGLQYVKIKDLTSANSGKYDYSKPFA